MPSVTPIYPSTSKQPTSIVDGEGTYQPLDADLTALAAAGNSTVLAATTASFLTADETALDALVATSRAIIAVFDGGGSAITVGTKRYVEVPFACTITGWSILGDQTGSIEFDIWKDTYANYPPTVADTIVASANPSVVTATSGKSSTLTGWTTAIAAGDVLCFNVDSVTDFENVTLAINVTQTI